MGRDTSGVRGIKLGAGDRLVGMVVADPDATLLTVCENGYGKRTPFGAGTPLSGPAPGEEGEATEPEAAEPGGEEGDGDGESSGMRYRTQHRGGKGIRDIKTTARNGTVVAVVSVRDDDQVLMMTARGKIQRVNVREIRPMGRNTQGVRIMRLDDADALAAVVPVAPGEAEEADAVEPLGPPEPGT
jgi:DNA gyrase subunit A